MKGARGMRSGSVGALVCVCVLLLLSTPTSAAGPEIFLRDEPEEYVMIDKLQGLGLLPGLMTGTRGLEAREVALEAGKEGNVEDPFVDGMLGFSSSKARWPSISGSGAGWGTRTPVHPPNGQGVRFRTARDTG